MRAPLKLSDIDQEHLQELYDAAGIARDELPYTPAFEALVQGFQDRTFKNAEPEQVFGAILKYVRSSSCAATEAPAIALSEDQLKHLKTTLPRFARGGKLLPYSEEFDAALKEFVQFAKVELSPRDFWHAILRAQGPKRRPPQRKPIAAAPTESEDEGAGE